MLIGAPVLCVPIRSVKLQGAPPLCVGEHGCACTYVRACLCVVPRSCTGRPHSLIVAEQELGRGQAGWWQRGGQELWGGFRGNLLATETPTLNLKSTGGGEWQGREADGSRQVAQRLLSALEEDASHSNVHLPLPPPPT